MTIDTSAKKINMEDSSSDSENVQDVQEENITSEVQLNVDNLIKRKPKLSRAHYKEMKRELKRRVKLLKLSGEKRKAERLKQSKDDKIKMRFKERYEGVRMELDS